MKKIDIYVSRMAAKREIDGRIISYLLNENTNHEIHYDVWTRLYLGIQKQIFGIYMLSREYGGRA